MKVYLNGEMIERDKAKISIFDHGLLYGDGVFEGIRSYDSLVFKLTEHIDRLYKSADFIKLRIPMTKKEMIDAVIGTLRSNKLRDAYIRLVVTRGVGDLGLDPRNCPAATVFIITDKIVLYPKEYYQKGLDLVVASTRRNLVEALDPRIKSLNYLNNILAKIEAIDAGTVEAIMLTHEGYIAECTGDNIFIVKKGKLSTPPVHIGALDGITRNAVIELSGNAGIPFSEALMKKKDLYDAEEIFLTGTAAEVVPVVKVDSRVIGTGKPGKMTLRLMDAFRKMTRVDGLKY
ncbi:MAG: branched-chain-amino-acid transaminase [Candidatus Omnitrophota bacterium]